MAPRIRCGRRRGWAPVEPCQGRRQDRGPWRACALALAFVVGLCAGCGMLEKAATPISIPGSALGVIVRGAYET